MYEDEAANLAKLGGLSRLVSIVQHSQETFAAVVDGVPIYVGGVMPGGRLWMLGSPAAERAKKFFLRSTRAKVAELHKIYPHLVVSTPRDGRSMNWLRWLGFAPVAGQDNGPVVELERFACA